MIRSVIGGLLGGLALFITGFLFWGTPLSALAISRADEQASANLQAALAQALNATGTGVYTIPDPSSAQGTILYGRGPVAQVFYNSSGFPVMDGGSLIGGLILSLLVGLLIGLALRFCLPDFISRVRAAIFLSLAAVLWIDIGQAVFMHAPWGYILYLGFSDFVGLALAGLIAAKLMETKAASASAEAGTLH